MTLAYSFRSNGAVIRQYQFDNGYGASVHKPPNAYLWELGVTTQPTDELAERPKGYPFPTIQPRLTWTMVEKLLELIENLGPIK